MVRLILLVALAACFAPAALAQRALTGTVTDAETGETLPGATVSVLTAAGAVAGGTATDLDGRFALRLATVPADVAVRFLGYETARLRVTAATPGDVRVALAPAAAALGEVTVTAGEDPGPALLRRVVARVRAQRAALGPYAVTAYQRTTLFTPSGDVRGVAESSSEAFWIPGTGWRETVVAGRRTSNLGPGGAAPGGVAAGLQDLLAEDLDVAGHRLMGPTHRDALGTYDATITGTSVLDGRLVAELSVRPRRATASAFAGTLQVLFDTADVLAADLRPGASFLFPPPVEVTGARFRQQFVPVAADSSLWLPADLRSDLAIGFRVEGLLSAEPFRVEETVQLSGYRLGAVAPDSLVAGPAVRRAARSDSADTARLAEPGVAPPLSPAERDAYARGDSLGAVSDVLVFHGPLAGIARRSVRVNVGGAADSVVAERRFAAAFRPVVAVNPAEGARLGAEIPLRAGPVRLRPLAAFRTADRGVTLGADLAVRLARLGPLRLDAVGSVFDGVDRVLAPHPPTVPVFGGRGGYYRSERLDGGLRLDAPRLGDVRQGEFLTFDTEAYADLRYGTETASQFDTPAPDRLDLGSGSTTVQSLRFDAGIGTLDEPLGLLPLRAGRVTAETGARGGRGYSRADVTLDGRIVTFGRRRVLPAALDVRLAGGVSSGSVPPVRQFALEGVVPVPFVGPALTAFGALRAQTGVPPAGARYALAAYEHSFRTLPFELLGLHALARRQYNVLVHGAHGRTWGGPLAHTRWHHEVGVSLSGLFGGLRLDLTQRLDRRQTVVGVGVARVF